MRLIAFDLDDTLYKEIDFLHSGYREIARRLASKYSLPYDEMYRIMLNDAGNAFDDLFRFLQSSGLPVTENIPWMVDTYRTHKPDISLDDDTLRTLSCLASAPCNRLALITDGRTVTQTAKIETLGLPEYIPADNISISEAIGREKSSRLPFDRMMDINPDCSRYYYIGDNPAKDFYWGNRLGWTTIQLRDDGRNIQRQNIVIPEEYQAAITIGKITDLLDIIKN